MNTDIHQVSWIRKYDSYQCEHPKYGLIELFDSDDTVGFKEPYSVSFDDSVGDNFNLSLNEEEHALDDWSQQGMFNHALEKVERLRADGYEHGVYLEVGRFDEDGKSLSVYTKSFRIFKRLKKGERWMIGHSPFGEYGLLPVDGLGEFDSYQDAYNKINDVLEKFQVIRNGRGNGRVRRSSIMLAGHPQESAQ